MLENKNEDEVICDGLEITPSYVLMSKTKLLSLKVNSTLCLV